MKYLLICMVIFILLPGCATKWDVELQRSHDVKRMALEQERTKRVQAIADAFRTALANADTPMERAMIARSIENVDTAILADKAPTLNTDNAGKALNTALGVTPFIAIGRVAEKSIENQQGNTINNNQDGAINIEGSLNREENHATAIRESTASLEKTGDQTSTSTTSTSNTGGF